MNLATLYYDPTLLEIYLESAVKGALVCFLWTAVWWTLHRKFRPKGTKAKIGMGFQYLFASAIGLAVLAIILGVLIEREERAFVRKLWRERVVPSPATPKAPANHPTTSPENAK